MIRVCCLPVSRLIAYSLTPVRFREIAMLVLIACLVGQFQPAEVKPVTLDEFVKRCAKQHQDAMSAQIEAGEEQIKKNRGNGKLLVTLRKQLATLKAEQKAPPPAIDLDFDSLSPGDVGAAMFSSTDGLSVIKAKVLQVPAKGILLCEWGERTFAVMGIDTGAFVDGDRLPLKGIWKVTGKLSYETVAGSIKTVIVIAPWEHSDAYAKLGEKPAPPPKKTTKPAPAKP